MAQFGEILAELRKDHSLKQRDLAEAIHVTIGTISNYETGTHYPDVEKLIELADFFHVTTDYLLGRSSVNISPDKLQQEFLSGKSLEEFISRFNQLSQKRKSLLASLIFDLSSGK